MNCPLCQQELLEIGEGLANGPPDYICRERIKFDGKASLSHYEQRDGGSIYWYIPPYQIVTRDKQTVVNKVKIVPIDRSANRGKCHRFAKPEFEHVFTMDEVFQPGEPDKILKRIKILTVFS